MDDDVGAIDDTDTLEVAGPQWHNEVPQAYEGAVGLGEEAEDHVVVVDHGGHLLSGVETLVHVPRPAPVEHARAVIVVADQLWLLGKVDRFIRSMSYCSNRQVLSREI